MCPDVNIELKSSVLYVPWQLSNITDYYGTEFVLISEK